MILKLGESVNKNTYHKFKIEKRSQKPYEMANCQLPDIQSTLKCLIHTIYEDMH